jgi:hypothetical protein
MNTKNILIGLGLVVAVVIIYKVATKKKEEPFAVPEAGTKDLAHEAASTRPLKVA